jgi:hypothetical protein
MPDKPSIAIPPFDNMSEVSEDSADEQHKRESVIGDQRPSTRWCALVPHTFR